MQNLSSRSTADTRRANKAANRRDILFLAVLGPLSAACFVAFFIATPQLGPSSRTIFLIAPLIIGGVWIGYEQLHDLVWWSIKPFCPTCRRAFAVSQRPRPGAICDCCDKPLYPLLTPQDYKVVVLITSIMVIGLPVFALWASTAGRLG